MNFFLRIILLIVLLICYKEIPVFEPRGVNYIISILCLSIIGFEIKKLWDSIALDESRKIKIQKITYLTLIILIIFSVILIMHKEYPASKLRFVRGVLILVLLTIGGKLVGIISKTQIKNQIKNTILFTFSAVSFIAIIEIIFMFISLSHGSGEAYSGKIWGNKYWNPINKLGFRDEEPKKGKNTVFFVGDSFTAGWGVKKIEDRFSETMASELKKKGITINEINLGRYGADTRLEFHVFKNFIDKSEIKPDHLVLQFFVNDMDKFISTSDRCSQKENPISSWKKHLIDGSYLINYLHSIYPSASTKLLPKECDYLENLKIAYKTDSIWSKEIKQLDKFKSYCSQNNISLTMVFFPFMEDLNLAKKLNIETRIKNYCTSNKINFINVTSHIKNLSRQKRQVSIVDSHASAEVHKIVGKVLSEKIKI